MISNGTVVEARSTSGCIDVLLAVKTCMVTLTLWETVAASGTLASFKAYNPGPHWASKRGQYITIPFNDASDMDRGLYALVVSMPLKFVPMRELSKTADSG